LGQKIKRTAPKKNPLRERKRVNKNTEVRRGVVGTTQTKNDYTKKQSRTEQTTLLKMKRRIQKRKWKRGGQMGKNHQTMGVGRKNFAGW